MFWLWLLKYSSFLITGVVSLIVGYVLHKLTTREAALVYYTSHIQWVSLPNPQNAQQATTIGTFTLFLWNPGKAPARDVHVGHYFLPANNVYPDIPRQTTQMPGGGHAIVFPAIAAKTQVNISYLFFGVFSIEQILSYIGFEGGSAKRIPVILQRVWPKWFLTFGWATLVLGLWVWVNLTLTLIKFLWSVYYK